jgi:ATP/maltotriose-dependent transcriptional regulator MalT
LASEDAVVSVAAMSTTMQESPPVLTPRQKQVVELIAAGCSNEEVGERLGISPRTAKAHCDVLRQKLGVARRRQIPHAYRELTGDDPLSKSLAPGNPGSGD